MRTYITLARPIALLGFTVLAAGACGDATKAVAPVVPTAPSLAKGGPNMPTTNGRIFFTSSFTGNVELYSMKSDGSDRRRLTLTDDEERFVNVSPDGKKLVVGSRRANGAGRDLLTMNADGTNRRVLFSTDNDATLAYPKFSPDGRTIAYMANLPNDLGAYGIWTVSASGGKLTRLTPETEVAFHPAWSPDGSRIVYVGGAPGSQSFDLYVMNADGSAPQLLRDCVDGCEDPVWSPDGSKIVYISRDVAGWEIQYCDLQNAVPLCGIQIPHQGLPTSVAFSPDGSQLVIKTQTYENNTSVDRVTISNVNGSGQTALTANVWAIWDIAWGR
jgi:WD40 repeat protein